MTGKNLSVKKHTIVSAVFIMFILAASLIGYIFNSTIFCRICAFLLLVFCIMRGSREKTFLNPYFLFSLAPLSLVIYADISRYHMELTTSTWLLAIINMLTFLLAVDFTRDYKKIKKCIGAGAGNQLLMNAVILFVLGFLPTVYTTFFGGTMPLASIFSLLPSAAMVCAMKSRNRSLILAVALLNILSWIGYVSKSTVLMFLLAILVSYEKYYLTTSKQRKKFIILAAIGILVMLMAFSFANQGRENASGTSALEYYTRYGGLKWRGSASLLMPYMYLTTPWTNLQFVMQTQDTRTFGLWFLRPVLGYLQIDGYFDRYYNLTAFSNFNTFSFVTCGFKDFGYFGSCISSAFLGFFTKKVYSRYCISRSPLDVACYVLTAQAVLEMFFSNHFFMLSYPFTIVILMGFYKITMCRKNKPELEREN